MTTTKLSLGLGLLGCFLLTQDTPSPGPRAGKLLAELLAPSEKLPPLPGEPTAPRHLTPPRSVEAPDLPLPPHQATPARPVLAIPSRPVRPHPLPEGLPLAHYRADPTPPQRIELPTGDRVRLPAFDVDEPVALPRLTTRPVDATPPEDPTAAASNAAALSAAPPQRTNPAPFLRLTLPDPFEHRDVLKLPRPVADDQPPAPVPVRLPEYKW